MSLSLKVANASGRGMPGVGDPGILGSLWSGIKKVAGVAKSIPGPVGWAGSAVARLGGSGGLSALQQRQLAKGQATVAGLSRQQVMALRPEFMPSAPTQAAPGIRAALERFVPGGETGMMPAEIGSPSGYHVNKTDYYLKDGTYVPAGSRWVKNRRRNPLNPRAASRAVGRIEALKKATARFSNITIRKKCCKK